MSDASDANTTEFNLIRTLPGFAGHSFNPQILVKVTNDLRALGKNGALALLRKYNSMSMTDQGANPENTWLVARAVFVPEREHEALPELHLGKPDVQDPGSALAPLFPLYVYEGMPWLLVGGYVTGGEALPAAEYLNWVERFATVLPEPLVPTDNPLDSVDRFIVSSAWKDFDSTHGWMLRLQALRAISSAVHVSERDVRTLLVLPMADQLWKDYRERVSKLGIRWNPRVDDYELRG